MILEMTAARVLVAVAAVTLGAALRRPRLRPNRAGASPISTGPRAGNPRLQGIAASGPDAAWASGSTFGDLLVYHWNGKSWNKLTAPARFE